MPATVSPQIAATTLSRRRSGGDGAFMTYSQRPDQHAWTLDQGDNVNYRHENAERDRNRDRTGAAAALLFLGQNSSRLGRRLIHEEAHENTRPNGRPI